MQGYFLNEFKIKDIPVGSMEVLYNLPKDSEKFLNYFEVEQRTPKKQLKQVYDQLNDFITIIKHIEIYPKFRKKNLGNKLLDQIIKNSKSDLILIAEIKDNFLLDWYERKGFELIGYSNNLPILIFKK